MLVCCNVETVVITTNTDTDTHQTLLLLTFFLLKDMESSFTWPIEVGETVDGIITLTAPMNGGVARHDLMVCEVEQMSMKFAPRWYRTNDCIT